MTVVVLNVLSLFCMSLLLVKVSLVILDNQEITLSLCCCVCVAFLIVILKRIIVENVVTRYFLIIY